MQSDSEKKPLMRIMNDPVLAKAAKKMADTRSKLETRIVSLEKRVSRLEERSGDADQSS